ncbi:MAG: TfoX/Sxy family protein [Nitrospira sp.]|nr:TfoX/Sxy family protein [Nitrospira sp.]
MPTKNDGFKDFILDQLTELNGVAARAMFGGYGLYQRAKFFGIIHKGCLYFKVSATTVHNYKNHGMQPFRPNAKQTLKSFYGVPIDVIEDAEILTQWAASVIES